MYNYVPQEAKNQEEYRTASNSDEIVSSERISEEVSEGVSQNTPKRSLRQRKGKNYSEFECTNDSPSVRVEQDSLDSHDPDFSDGSSKDDIIEGKKVKSLEFLISNSVIFFDS
jgi:hypothetical protein